MEDKHQSCRGFLCNCHFLQNFCDLFSQQSPIPVFSFSIVGQSVFFLLHMSFSIFFFD